MGDKGTGKNIKYEKAEERNVQEKRCKTTVKAKKDAAFGDNFSPAANQINKIGKKTKKKKSKEGGQNNKDEEKKKKKTNERKGKRNEKKNIRKNKKT